MASATRTRCALGLAALLVLGLAATSAHAQIEIDLVFESQNGSPIGLTDIVEAAPGDVLVMGVYLTNSVVLSSMSFSLAFDRDGFDELDVDSSSEWLGLGNFVPLTPGLTVDDSAPGSIQSFDGYPSDFSSFLPAGSYRVGEVTWIVNDPRDDGDDIESGLFAPAIDGFFDENFNDVVSLVEFRTAQVVPALAPAVRATKSDEHAVDVDQDGDVDPGDTLRYTIVVSNVGTADALDVALTDVPSADTALVAGSVTTSQGTVDVGNAGGDTDVAVSIGTLAASQDATIVFDVVVADPFPNGVDVVVNQATVSGSNFGSGLSDDPDTQAAGDATTTLVISPLDTCVADLGMCSSDLGTCQGDLGTCQADLADTAGDLATCQASLGTVTTDDDGDGVPDFVDQCPGTAGGAVDLLGCSLAQFCASYDTSGTNRNSPCNQADWKNDEPFDAEDCKARGGVCLPR